MFLGFSLIWKPEKWRDEEKDYLFLMVMSNKAFQKPAFKWVWLQKVRSTFFTSYFSITGMSFDTFSEFGT